VSELVPSLSRTYLLCDGVDEPDVQVLLLAHTCNNNNINTRMRTHPKHLQASLTEQSACHGDGTRPDHLITDYQIICSVARQNYFGDLYMTFCCTQLY